MELSARFPTLAAPRIDRKCTRLNSSHTVISYAVFCLKKKKISRRSATCALCSNLLMVVCLLPDEFFLTLEKGSPDFFFFNDTATTEIYTLSLHDALPI